MKIRKNGAGRLVVLIAACGLGAYALTASAPNDARIAPASAGSRDTPPTRVWDLMPPDERAFITAVQDGVTAYRAGQADARAARARKICDIPQLSQPLEGWVGRMVKFSKTSDGKGVLSLSLSQDIYVATGDGPSPQALDNFLIAPDDRLFARLSLFREAQLLRFFGEFVKGDTDCVKEASLAVDSAMTQPTFFFRFTDVLGL